MQTNIDITQAFLDVPDGVLSIHQLHQKMKMPYGTTYNRIHQLNSQKIIQILPQGKAKLCALNGESSMTANLLALGGAQKTENFINSLADEGKFLRKVIRIIKDRTKGKVLSVILIAPDAIKEISKAYANPQPNLPDMGNSVIVDGEEIPDYLPTIDLFIVKTGEKFDESILEDAISTILPLYCQTSVTSMVVDKDTMIGMMDEEENGAGIAAYNMLHEGIVLYGFESFYETILEAFSKKLTTLG